MSGKSKKRLSRREFLKASKSLGVGALALTSGCATMEHLIGRHPSATSPDPLDLDVEVEGYFDYVVVGSGAGGGPLACRLALAGYSVGLIEAGEDYLKGFDKTKGVDTYSTPALHAFSALDPRMSWSYWVNHYSNPEQAAKDDINLKAKGILYPRAGTLGGCTAHNAMFTLVPDDKDWNEMEKLTNDPSWAADKMRGYFRKIEDCGYLKPRTGDPMHGWGKDHWLPTEMSSKEVAFFDEHLRRIAEAGLIANAKAGRNILDQYTFLSPSLSKTGAQFSKLSLPSLNLATDVDEILDPNSASHFGPNGRKDGMYLIPKATKNGVRRGTREFILKTVEECKKFGGRLTILDNHLASRLIFSPDALANGKKIVIGVECYLGSSLYAADGRTKTPQAAGQKKVVRATREVILSGGVFNSPQLLQLSGIGDAGLLRSLGIDPVIPELRGVGQNLQDRYEIGVVNQFDTPIEIINECKPDHTDDPCLEKYLRMVANKTPLRSGYSSNGALLAFLQRSKAAADDSADLCIFGTPGAFTGYRPDYAHQGFKPTQFTWVILKGYTSNPKGEVRIRSTSPFDQPEINFNYFQEDPENRDINALCEAVEFVRGLNENEPVMGLQSETRRKNANISEVTPGPAKFNQGLMKDEELRDWIRSHAWGHHASCTNKIGTDDDPNAVLDSSFKVRGTDNLRVVDASSFPKIPGLYIVTPIYMISEKAADVILADPNAKRNS